MSFLQKNLTIFLMLALGIITVVANINRPMFDEPSNNLNHKQQVNPHDSERNALMQTLESINLRLANLEKEYRNMKDNINMLALAQSQAPIIETDNQVLPEPLEYEEPPELEPEQKEALKQQKINQISDFHDAESLDSDGTIKIQNMLEQSMQRLALDDSNLNSVDCRSSFCRMEFSHADNQSRTTLTGQVGMLLDYPSDGVILAIDNGTDIPDTVVYVTREGQELPDFIDKL